MSEPDEIDTRRWVLRPLGVAGFPSAIEIPADGLTFGRDPACDVYLDAAAFPQVSAHHARVTLHVGTVEIEDLGSTNGTRVNDVAVLRVALETGDVLQLGELGPRFAIVRDAGLDDTLEVTLGRHGVPGAPGAPGVPSLEGLGASALSDLRDALGAADQEDVDSAVEASGRRNTLFTLGTAALVLVAAGAAAFYVRETSHRESEALRELSRSLASELEEARADLLAQRGRLDTQRDDVLEERGRLIHRIQSMEDSARGASGDLEGRLGAELATLRLQLEGANARLELFDPVSLEKERLRDVARVQSAVVLIETVTRLRDTSSRRALYVARDADGRDVPNLDFEGEPYAQESSGSGFCVSAAGHVITNAHVVMPADRRTTVDGPDGRTFEVETELRVVFTGTSRRHPARVLRVTSDADEDLALVQIVPYPDMPFIEDFETTSQAISPGTEVYLFGFPLGMMVLQDGDRVVASTFKGILSREVGGYLQIDAAVHPGNSGGPVTDATGRVVGIVSRVQAGPNGSIASAIGYVIPVEHASRVWPPPKDVPR